MATVWTGPYSIANTGAINMPEPTPAKPRISPAAAATPRATRSSCVRISIPIAHNPRSPDPEPDPEPEPETPL